MLVASCSASETEDPIARGERLFFSPDVAASPLNSYSCGTCHDTEAHSSALIKPGAALAGSTLRSSFWGGQENDLLSAVNQCLANFMRSPTRLTSDDDDAVALYAFLQSLEPGDSNAVPFETVRFIDNPLARGDAVRGAGVYANACGYCHGEPNTGSGRLSDDVTLLPQEVIAEHEGFTPRELRLVLIEKVRHGRFYGYGGVMPPFSPLVLSDEDLADVLELLGLTGE